MSVLALAARGLIAAYYRRFELGDAPPDEGPLILVANHPNGLVDPVLLIARSRRRLRLLAKAPLFDLPVLGRVVRAFGALPVYRSQDGADTAQNERTFEAVFDALDEGSTVCLFPEGRSHSEPNLQRLKTGAARMALGADARRDFRLGVRVLPIGIVYHDKACFRSKVATWVGEPIELSDLAELYARDERAAVQAANERIAAGLSKVTLNLSRWDDWPRLQLVERIWRGGGGRRVERLQRIARAAERLRAELPGRLEEVERRLIDFERLLQRLDIAPEHMEPRYSRGRLARFTLQNVIGLGLGWPLAVLGWLTWITPWTVVGLVRRALRPEEDQRATVRILAAAVFYPLWYTCLCVATGVLVGPWTALGVAVVAPFLGALAVWFARRGRHVLADLSVAWRLARSRSARERLLERRAQLERDLESLQRDLRTLDAGARETPPFP